MPVFTAIFVATFHIFHTQYMTSSTKIRFALNDYIFDFLAKWIGIFLCSDFGYWVIMIVVGFLLLRVDLAIERSQ